MRTLNEIQQEIRPICQRVEQYRLEQHAKYKKGLSMMLIPLAVIVLMALWIMATGADGNSLPVGLTVGVIAIVACFIIYYAVANKHKKAYRSEFKSKVMQVFVEMLYPTLQYNVDRSVSSSVFSESELFKNPDRYSGEDYFSGTLGNVKLEFSEVHAVDVTTSRDSKGRTRTSTSTIFKGLFFLIESPQPIYGNVVVVPDVAERSLGGFGRWIQRSLGSLYQGKKMVYFEEHPEFEKQFVVYTNEEEEARRLLTPSLLETIYNLRNKWKNQIHIAFKSGKIFLALPLKKNLFESDISRSLTKDNVIEDLYQEMALCFSAIESFANFDTKPNSNRGGGNEDDYRKEFDENTYR